MSDFSLKLNQGAINKMLQSPQGDVGRYIHKLGVKTVLEAKALAPTGKGATDKHKGALRDSISISLWPGPRLSLQVTANVRYALAVHEGSGPHEIKGKPWLAFPGKGGGPKLTVVRSVRHPGHPKGNPFLMKALRRAVALR